MFEKLESCEVISLAFPHRLTPNAFCLALFIMEYHDSKIHKGSFYTEPDGMPLFMALFNCSSSDFQPAFNELFGKGILFSVDAMGFYFEIDINKFN